MAKMQKQQSHSNNCGLFAIAVTTAILFKDDLEKLVFKEQEMRQHLLQCFEKATIPKVGLRSLCSRLFFNNFR